MFIRSSRSHGCTYVRLAKGYRDARGKSRQHQIAQPGRAENLTEDKVQRIVRSLNGVESVSHVGAFRMPHISHAPEGQ